MTKVVFIFTCCIALALAAFADQDQHKKKGQGQGQDQGQGQVQGKGKGQGQGQRFKGQGQGQKFKGQGMGQGQGQKFKGQGQGQKFKGQGMGQGQGQKFKGQGMGQGQGQKFKGQGQGQKFKGQAQGQKLQGQKFKGQKFQAKHFNLANKPNPNIPNVKFSKNYHIQGSQHWKGSKYLVFRNYRPVWHNQFWWTSHYRRTVFVFGGWYYWNSGYWYPAWGYDPGAVYYYDGPIYASSPEMDPGQVVANVQTALQSQTGPDGQPYYQGDVDGILGPQTRAALAEYQQANGLEPTSAIDEPTLDSLGMG